MNKDIAKELGVSEATVSQDLLYVSRMKYEGIFKKDELIQAKTDAILTKLLSVWMPIATSTKLAVGETRTNKKGEEYDIELPDYKAGIEATDRVIKIVEQMAKNHGIQSPRALPKTIDPQLTGESVGHAVLTMMQQLATKQAHVVEDKKLPDKEANLVDTPAEQA